MDQASISRKFILYFYNMKAGLFKIVRLWLLFMNPHLFLSKKKDPKTLVLCRELQKHTALPLCIMKRH